MSRSFSLQRRKALLAGAAAVAAPGLALAQIGGGKPVTLVVSYPPGGGADLIARLISAPMAKALGQNVIVDNRPGGSGQIAAGLVARSAPDGGTLLLDASSFAVNPSLFPKLPYDSVKDFAPLGVVALFPNVLVCTPGFEAHSVKDLVRMAKAAPGKIAFASSGNGSAQHLAGALFESRAGVELVHVPYRGGGPAMNDVIGGQVPLFFANVASSLGHIEAGRLRPLAVTTRVRARALPKVPTMEEAGVPGYEVLEWKPLLARGNAGGGAGQAAGRIARRRRRPRSAGADPRAQRRAVHGQQRSCQGGRVPAAPARAVGEAGARAPHHRGMTPRQDTPAAAARWDCHVHVFEAGAATLPGHYAPAPAPLAAIERIAGECGIGHLVLVQPSVYGTDNDVMERALRAAAGRHRGVAVVDADVGDATLDRLHEAGVRGVRFNLVSPVGNGPQALLALAPRLRERGWHVQWYADQSQLVQVADLQARTGLRFVLDHLAGLRVDAPASAESWVALRRLAAADAWVKLSGWYRLGDAQPYGALVPMIRQVADLFGERMVWGSDWPHTALPASAESRHASLLQPVRDALGEARLARCLQGAGLYGA